MNMNPNGILPPPNMTNLQRFANQQNFFQNQNCGYGIPGNTKMPIQLRMKNSAKNFLRFQPPPPPNYSISPQNHSMPPNNPHGMMSSGRSFSLGKPENNFRPTPVMKSNSLPKQPNLPQQRFNGSFRPININNQSIALNNQNNHIDQNNQNNQSNNSNRMNNPQPRSFHPIANNRRMNTIVHIKPYNGLRKSSVIPMFIFLDRVYFLEVTTPSEKKLIIGTTNNNFEVKFLKRIGFKEQQNRKYQMYIRIIRKRNNNNNNNNNNNPSNNENNNNVFLPAPTRLFVAEPANNKLRGIYMSNQFFITTEKINNPQMPLKQKSKSV